MNLFLVSTFIYFYFFIKMLEISTKNLLRPEQMPIGKNTQIANPASTHCTPRDLSSEVKFDIYLCLPKCLRPSAASSLIASVILRRLFRKMHAWWLIFPLHEALTIIKLSRRAFRTILFFTSRINIFEFYL